MLRRTRLSPVRILIAALLGFPVLVLAGAANAETINGAFDASLTSGSLAGTNFSGTFSYDNSGLIGSGEEFLTLLSFNFTLDGAQFTKSDIGQGGQAVFQNGVLQYVTAAFFPPPPANAPVSDIAFGFGNPTSAIGYRDLTQQFGSGSYSFVAVATPEPSVFLLLGIGLVFLTILRSWAHRAFRPSQPQPIAGYPHRQSV